MFDPVRICRILNEEGVDFIVVGGMATVMHGSVLPTQDLDVVPDRATENLERLARALVRMNSRIRTRDEVLDVRIEATFLANSTVMLNLICDHGDLDIAFRPSGPSAASRAGGDTPSRCKWRRISSYWSAHSTTSSNRNGRPIARRTEPLFPIWSHSETRLPTDVGDRGQSAPRVSRNPGGMTRSSGPSSEMSDLASPNMQASIPPRRMSSTFSTPA